MSEKLGAIKKFRAFADIGRTQGITVTASVAICGALSSTANVYWYHIVYFTLIAIFYHTVLNTYIAKGDVYLDSKTYVPERNPLINCKLKEKEARGYVYFGTIIFFILTIPFFFTSGYDLKFVLPTFLCLLLSYIWLIWYGYNGKKMVFSYDFSFSVSWIFLVLFGVFAVGGAPTRYTLFFILVTIFATTAFAQWENGLKDVDADRAAGVKSLAVLTNVKSGKKLGFHPYLIYGTGLKICFLFSCLLAYFVYKNIYYLLFVLGYGVSSQTFILWRFAVKEKPIEHRKTILFDVTLSSILIYSVIFGKIGIILVVLLIIYLIVGYLIGSALQSECEFKFRRFSGENMETNNISGEDNHD